MANDKSYAISEKPVCSIMFEEKVQVSDDFIAILSDESGNASIFYHTDAMTMGMAIKLVAHEYIRLLKELPDSDQAAIVGILGAEFSAEALEVPGQQSLKLA